MPFTDAELAAAMRARLVEYGVMTEKQQGKLLNNKTAEIYVRETLSEEQLKKFANYWDALGVWMTSKGGDITKTKGSSVPGREGDDLGLDTRPIYNDAFNDVNKYIVREDFSPVKAVSNHLRFVSAFDGGGDDSAKSCCIVS
jgi:hypothetical protein